ncbi:Serine/arginine repetitive matrix protein 2 [Rhodotorula toruloides ATCC 204091]|uniref:Serine/arginine repetitive matrix protein 2 n=1 Tax=Rhodotorula toruloides TaxID=5286 RepID=A0A0K3CJX0_RHOTO|nr:Serine/arginine repetitive matrix protein 2 [Rhodotorula toruloides ATCC 204091]KAK4332255.1 Serine/arginine repetitive matrix protein 2 [Rhodotorula toruloides]PRQ72531.1 Serine/arginine repetitive matrix protein 2 [Rhodotorula toruloides]
MASSDDDTQKSTVFKGVYAYVHGEFAGLTRRRVGRMVEEGGGKVIDKLDNPKITHMILSPQLWSRQGTTWADLTVRQTIRANEENRTEEDENYNRVWLLPLEWLTESLAQKKRLDERKHDYERTKDQQRAERAAQLREENKKYGGKSRFGRGERQKYEREKAVAAELEAQKKIEAEGVKLDDQAFSGLSAIANKAGPSSSGSVAAVAAVPPPAVAPIPTPPPGAGGLSSDLIKQSLQAQQDAKYGKRVPPPKPKTPAEVGEHAVEDGSKTAAEKEEKRAKMLRAAESRETKKLKPSKAPSVEKKPSPPVKSTAPIAASSPEIASQAAVPKQVAGSLKPKQPKPSAWGAGTSRPLPKQFTLPPFGPAPSTTSSASASTSTSISQTGQKRDFGVLELSDDPTDSEQEPLAQQVAKKRKLSPVAPSSDTGSSVKSKNMPSSEIDLLDSDP